MYCYRCQRSIEEYGGSQMTGCRHFLCFKCIRKEVRKTVSEGVKCRAPKSVYQCEGYLPHELLEHLVPDDVYAQYLERISSTPEEADAEGSTLDALEISPEEKESGWAHKAAIIDHFVRERGLTRDEAIDHLNFLPILENQATFSCPICLDDVTPSNGVVLKDCMHMFCKDCLRTHIESCETADVICPFVLDEFRCNEPLKTGEIRALVSDEVYRRHFEELSLREAESRMGGVFHCLTANCRYFCITEGMTQGIFVCPQCRARNCISCKVIHDGTCQEFRQRIEDDRNRAQQQINERMNIEEINRRLGQRQWMRCPGCSVVIEKNQGCAHMKCRNCSRDFQWTGIPS